MNAQSPLQAAQYWISLSFLPVPVRPRSKKPYNPDHPEGRDWQNLRITAETADRYFNGAAQNIGVLLGDDFGSADVDLDCLEAVRIAPYFLPETGLQFGRHSKPASHWFYRIEPAIASERLVDPVDDATLLELRCRTKTGTIGYQTVVPSSVHESGELIRFETGFDQTPANVDADVLQSAVRKIAGIALLARHWPKQGSRHGAFLALAGVLARSQFSVEDAIQIHRALYRCLWPANPALASADSEVRTTYEKFEAGSEVTGARTLVELLDKKVVDAGLRWLGIERGQRCDYLRNDTGNADRLADLHSDDLIYCTERRSFFVWTGKQWLFDEFAEAEKLAEKTMLDALTELKDIPEPEARKGHFKFVNKSLSRQGLANMIHLTKKKVRHVSTNDLDRDPWLLNVANGTIDLRTGTLCPHNRSDLQSKMIPIKFDAQAECPQFMKFIFRIMGSHADASQGENERAEAMVNYLQTVLGCAATGKPEKVLFIFYGEGNNGKTTLIEVIRDTLGDREYAGQVQVDSLMVRPKEAQSSNAVNTDIADLQGCRFVSSSEVEQGQRLSISRIKYLTGGGQVKARRLRENMITFPPVYKLFLDCNHKPVITDPHDAVWNRVKCIPFKVEIPKSEIDTNLPAKLRAELPGILRWIVEGAALYHRDGLGDPPDVMEATEAYRQESDRLKEFLEDRCVLAPPGSPDEWKRLRCWVPINNLFPTYLNWAEATGTEYTLSKTLFEERLARLGRIKDRIRPDGGRESAQVRVWLGIRFRTEEDDRKGSV